MAQTPIKGLYTDARPVTQPAGTYPFAKNGLQTEIDGAVSNEEGFQRMQAVLPYKYNGVIETDSKPIIFSTDNVNSAIGYFNPETGAYEPIFNDSTLPYKLGLKVENFVTGQAQRNYKNEIVCAFTDRHTFPKCFNADNLQVNELDDWNLFPTFRFPTFNTTVESGGRVPPGAYYVTTRYEKVDGTTTGYAPLSSVRFVDPDELGVTSSKLLRIEFSDLDQGYDFIVPIIVSKVNGVTTAVELEPVAYDPVSRTVTVSFTGDNLTTPITLEEVLTPPAEYSKVGTIGQLNDALYLGALESPDELLDLQPYALDVEIKYQSKLLNAVNPGADHTTGKIRGFRHEEVYAFYIRYRLKTGRFTKAFVIANREPTTQELQPAQTAGFPFPNSAINLPVYQVEDTCTGSPFGKTGNPGTWMNQTEFYPNTPDFATRANRPVCHFKMPSIGFCKDTFYPLDDAYGKTKLDLLGIYAQNVQIPAKYTNIIDGYQILYARRDVSNMTVMGQSLLLFNSFRVGDINPTDMYTTGSNWNSTAELLGGTTPIMGQESLQLTSNSIRLHAFDLLLNKPAFEPTHISLQMKLRKDNVHPTCIVQDGVNGQDPNTSPTVYLLDFTAEQSTAQTVPGSRVRKMLSGTYVPTNTDFEVYKNARHETCFAGKFALPPIPIAAGLTSVRTDLPGHADFVETYLTNIIVAKPNLYQNFYSQVLVAGFVPVALSNNTPQYVGDTFIGPYSFMTYGRHGADDTYRGYFDASNRPWLGKKVIHRFVCESTSNMHLRYEEAGNEYTKFYPKSPLNPGTDSDTSYPELFLRTVEPNQFGYRRDFNALNDLQAISIYSPYREFINKFPHRIHRGGKLSRQNKYRSWRSFLPLDYYDMQKNMGPIVNVAGLDDRLLIHCANSLFLTQDKLKLESGLLGVTLGTGDIFQLEPQEVVGTQLGYAGSQHQLACVKTPLGYVFADAVTGEIFLFKGELKNLVPGMRKFFREYLKVTGDNPFYGNGIAIGWDPTFKRLLITVKNEVPTTKFRKYENTPEFWDSLEDGDIVFWKNTFIRYNVI